MGVVTFRRTMSDDATPRDVPAEEGACMPRSEHAKPSDESALATRVPSPAHREKATTSKYRGVRQRTDAHRGSWTADIRGPNGKRLHSGPYDTAEEAVIVNDTTQSWIARWCKLHCGASCIARCTATGCVGGCVGGCGSCAAAARMGHVGRLKYAHENGCAWDERACFEAAWGGHLECLQYLHENGCPWAENACTAAATGGHLECLQYLHENECAWDENTCFEAANHGHLESLRYAHENGCPLDLAIVKFCLEKGLVWDDETSYIAATTGHRECLQYVLAVEQSLNNIEMEIATTMVDMATRRYRRWWTQEEDDALREGIYKHGERWVGVKNDPTFSKILENRSWTDMFKRWCYIKKREGKRTPPRVRRRWTQEEEDALREGIDKHGKRWEDIKNDPTFSQILKIRSLKDISNKRFYIEKREGKRPPPKVIRRWTREEEDALGEGVDKHGRRWADIQNDPTFSQILINRSQKDMASKWCKLEKREGERTRLGLRRWTQEEEDALRTGVDKHGRRWVDIKNDPTLSQILENRSRASMRLKVATWHV